MATASQKWITDPALIAKYNRGPITSAFIPPTSCTETLSLYGGTDDLSSVLYFGFYGKRYRDPSCYPFGTLSASDIYSTSSWTRYYYSPAICPSGWDSTPFTGTLPAYGESNEISIGPRTSVALCCPGGYVYKTRGHVCVSHISKGQVVTYVSASDQGTFSRGTTVISTFEEASSASGYGVPIFWQASDEMIRSAASTQLPTSTASGTAQPSSTSPFPSATGSSTPPATPEPSSSGLTTGAKVGIGVGISVIGVVIVAIGVFFFLRRRLVPAHTEAAHEMLDIDTDIKSHTVEEARTETHELPANPTEMYANEMYEMGHEPSRLEHL